MRAGFPREQWRGHIHPCRRERVRGGLIEAAQNKMATEWASRALEGQKAQTTSE